MGDTETSILLLVVIIIGSLIGASIIAWVFAFFFDSKEKLKEMKKQTDLLIIIAEKLKEEK